MVITDFVHTGSRNNKNRNVIKLQVEVAWRIFLLKCKNPGPYRVKGYLTVSWTHFFLVLVKISVSFLLKAEETNKL